jgi:putative phage-type endonuclease
MDRKNIQGTSEWLENRKNHIGASDAPVVMGVSPWDTPYKLWENKLGLIPDKKNNVHMQRGTDLEPLARAAFEEEHGIEVFPEVIYHPDIKFMMASLDGLSLDGKVAVEIKCPGNENHVLAMGGEVPHHYYPQLQHQLACSGLDSIWYYSFDGEKGVSILVKRDDAYIEEMIQKENAFWECVQSFTPPAMSNKDYENRESALWSGYCNRLLEIDELSAELKKERDAIKTALIKDCEGQSSKGSGISLTKTFPKGRINYSSIPELKELDLENYRSKPKETWTLRISKKAKL